MYELRIGAYKGYDPTTDFISSKYIPRTGELIKNIESMMEMMVKDIIGRLKFKKCIMNYLKMSLVCLLYMQML